jgi:hypothetical protein
MYTEPDECSAATPLIWHACAALCHFVQGDITPEAYVGIAGVEELALRISQGCSGGADVAVSIAARVMIRAEGALLACPDAETARAVFNVVSQCQSMELATCAFRLLVHWCGLSELSTGVFGRGSSPLGERLLGMSFAHAGVLCHGVHSADSSACLATLTAGPLCTADEGHHTAPCILT